MHTIIHLHDLTINSLSNPHDDLPPDMRMSVQIVLDGHIFLQTVPVESEPSVNCWKVRIDCKILSCPFFECLVIRHSQPHGFRLIGWCKIQREKAMISGTTNSALCLKLVKVNHDGPSLEARANFSLSELSSTEAYTVDGINIPENQITSLSDQEIMSRLMWLHRPTSTATPLTLLEIRMIHERILLLSPGNRTRKVLLNLLGSISFTQWESHQRIEDLNQAIGTYGDAVRDDPLDAFSLAAFGRTLHDRFERLGDIGDLNDSVSALEKSVARTLSSHPIRARVLNDLGKSLLRRFEQLGNLDDLSNSLLVFGDADNLTPDGHPEKHGMLGALGIAFMYRFEGLGDLRDLMKSISAREDAVRLTPCGHPDRPVHLGNLGTSLLTHFEHLGDLHSLNRSVSLQEEALHLTPHGDHHRRFKLSNLGAALRVRFGQLGNLADLNRAVLIGNEGVGITPDSHVDKPSALNDLGTSLLTRFKHLGGLNDLNHSISMSENAVHLTPDHHPDKAARFRNLGHSLCQRYERLRDLGDLQRSVVAQKDSIRLTPENHPDKPERLSDLSHSLFLRFKRLGEVSDLKLCSMLAENVLKLTPDGHTEKSNRLNHLGNVLLSRFEHLGDLGDVNMSVVQHENAVRLTPDGHASKPLHLIGLGMALRQRFEHLGDLDDLQQALSIFADAVQLTPDGDPDKPTWMNNFGVALYDRFGRLGDLDDLKKCVQMAENAVQLVSNEQIEKPVLLNNLSIALFYRFERLGDLGDLNKSISTEEESLSLTPGNHPQRQARLSNLGMLLFHRFEELGDLEDLERSILLGKEAVYKTLDGHPDKPGLLTKHSMILLRFREQGNPVDAQEMITRLRSAARSITGPPHIRFNAAVEWARFAQIEDHSSLLDAYGVVLDLLPELSWPGLSIRDRHHHILGAGEVARNAATAAIVAGSPEKAVEWLEQGRSIIWGQLLNLRTPVDDLRTHHPLLADKFISLSTQLEGTATRGGQTEIAHSVMNAQRSHDYALERDRLLKEIRGLEGFDRFLLPKTISELSQAAQGGPVVILNLSADRCDALILVPTLDVIHIFLPDFTLKDAEKLSQSLHELVHHRGRNDRLLGQREGSMNQEDEFAHILSELWIKLVKPVLNGLSITTPLTRDPQRIWWCPTGPLTFLPIHAAGIYGTNEVFGSKLSDYAISSYAPSLTALIQGFRPRSKPQEQLQLLAIAQASADGQAYIPGTQEEIAHIQKHTHGKVPVLRLDGNLATIDNVQAGMRDSSWVHFACHGVQNGSAPTESALLLAGNSRLTLSSIIKLSLPEADLAFLSACQTATGDEMLQEEAVHLASGMLLAGYRGVIATMWTIMDGDAPKVASDVYEHLFQTSPPDSTRAAEALHLAVMKLRDGSGRAKSFSHWVPFIHVGV
ncbi:CHAT domain-containing protein [Mycena epipterygia]|nr:CHAT domain-containing protein [Mycena epipterygia]